MHPLSPVLPLQPQNEVVYAKDQPEYNKLPAIRLDCRQGEVITRWRPNAEELELLNRGESIFLHIWTFGDRLQPILIEVDTADNIESRINVPHTLRYIELVEDNSIVGSKVN